MTVKQSQLEAMQKYVHKHKIENVLVYNLRRALPVYLEKNTVDTIIRPQLSAEEEDIFNQFFTLHKPGEIELPEDSFWKDLDEREVYLLFNIPHRLDLGENSQIGEISDKDMAELTKYYVKEESSEVFNLKKDISEIEEAAVVRILDNLNIHMSDEEKVKLSEILAKIEGLELTDVFFANLYNPSNHVFFYEHPNEHIPGMLIIEAIRQFYMACCHEFGKVPFKGSHFILNVLNSEFHNYVELNYPVRMKGEILAKKVGRPGFWSYSEMEITVIQNDEVCASFILRANVIQKRMFTRLRKDTATAEVSHRFHPKAKFYHRVSLWNEDKEEFLNAQLLDISLSGFRLEFDENTTLEGFDENEFTLCFEDVGFIKGKCKLLWKEEGDTRTFAGFKMSHISDKNMINLKESIKRYCYIIEKREII